MQCPEHPQEREFTIADMTATEIDAKWSALETMSGGGRMHDRPGALVARVKTYALLHHRPEQMAFAAAAILNNRSISFFAQITPQMGLDQILGLPEKPKKPAKAEAIVYYRQGLTSLAALPASPERGRRELELQMGLGTALTATEGWGSSDVEKAYSRALELCHQIGDAWAERAAGVTRSGGGSGGVCRACGFPPVQG
jgi:hypothetical protein